VEANARYVLRQTRIPANFDQIDYPRPPADYFVAGVGTGCVIKTGKQTFRVSATVTNLFNVKYRDYLDVFRYFIDQPGTNVVLRLGVPINQP
jgi:iron complex outermembrane receptor protein